MKKVIAENIEKPLENFDEVSGSNENEFGQAYSDFLAERNNQNQVSGQHVETARKYFASARMNSLFGCHAFLAKVVSHNYSLLNGFRLLAQRFCCKPLLHSRFSQNRVPRLNAFYYSASILLRHQRVDVEHARNICSPSHHQRILNHGVRILRVVVQMNCLGCNIPCTQSYGFAVSGQQIEVVARQQRFAGIGKYYRHTVERVLFGFCLILSFYAHSYAAGRSVYFGQSA